MKLKAGTEIVLIILYTIFFSHLASTIPPIFEHSTPTPPSFSAPLFEIQDILTAKSEYKLPSYDDHIFTF